MCVVGVLVECFVVSLPPWLYWLFVHIRFHWVAELGWDGIVDALDLCFLGMFVVLCVGCCVECFVDVFE